MNELHHVDVVQVVSSSSVWHGLRGIIVDIIERDCADRRGKTLEYAVQFGHERCWFMAEHLATVGSRNMVEFFRSEAMDRWHLTPQQANSLDGRRDQLIAFLRDCYDFSIHRATTEVDEFLRMLAQKIERATHVSTHSTALSPGQMQHTQSATELKFRNG